MRSSPPPITGSNESSSNTAICRPTLSPGTARYSRISSRIVGSTIGIWRQTIPPPSGGEGPPVDWFENSRRAVLTHRQRCIEASRQFPTLGENRWGLAPCAFRDKYLVHEVRPNIERQGRLARWRRAAVRRRVGHHVHASRKPGGASRIQIITRPQRPAPRMARPDQGGYAFVDSFSLAPPYGHDENLGIDVGPLLLAIENVRSGLIWRLVHEARRRQAGGRTAAAAATLTARNRIEPGPMPG